MFDAAKLEVVGHRHGAQGRTSFVGVEPVAGGGERRLVFAAAIPFDFEQICFGSNQLLGGQMFSDDGQFGGTAVVQRVQTVEGDIALGVGADIPIGLLERAQ